MRFHDLNIRNKLTSISILLLVVPIVVLGVISYIKFRSDVIQSTKKEIISTAKNWQIIASSYIQQEDRVTKREQVLVEQRLQTTVLTAKKILELSKSNFSQQDVYDEISKIRIGRSGYVFIMDPKGTLVVSQNRLRDGQNLWKTLEINGENFIQELSSTVQSLDSGDTYTTSYMWKQIEDLKLRKILSSFTYSKEFNLILGAATYYSDFQSIELKRILQDELRERMSVQKIKNRGYVEAINSSGEYLVSKDNLRNGENILNFQDENGKYVVKEIIEKAKELKFGETYTTTYEWKNIGEEEYFKRITTFTYVPEWDWIIGATAYEEDYLSVLNTILLYIILIGIAAIFIGSFFAYRFADYITRPIKALERIALRATGGDLTVRVSDVLLKEAAEIGSLSRSFNDMIVNVEGKILLRTKELKEEQARLLASINSIPFGFLVADKDNRVLLKNRMMTEMFAVDEKKELFLNDIFKILGKDSELNTQMQRCFVEKSMCEINDIVFNGKIFRGIIAPVVGTGGNDSTIGHILLLEDVTEAKSLERSRDEFFSIASHELRTPLTAIRGNSQMLEDNYKTKIVDPDMSEMIHNIHVSSIHLISIVNDFLEVSRLEQGKIEIKKEKFSISEIITVAIKDMEAMIKEKGISLDYNPQLQGSLMVFSDKGKVQQILANLLGNAIKFTSKGGVTVKGELVGTSIKISITDTGLGISEANQGLLFRKFQQASENVLARDVTQGTGLGLYISKLIAEKLGGTLLLEKSVLGEGSTFAFTFPLDS